ncbi:Membrane protein [Mycena venus]|uniref:Membrane protein n=1 Tax=Mycena venus TaxID=2733690 RepID=A0A8H6Z3N8_9AGAR|nr:Membrane protein [Mycena venus]
MAALANKRIVIPGHYRALEWSEWDQVYAEALNLGIWVEVDVHPRPYCSSHQILKLTTQEMKNGHSVINTKGPSNGWFTSTSHEASDHSIGLSTDCTLSFPNIHIWLYLDVVVGFTKTDTEHDRSCL